MTLTRIKQKQKNEMEVELCEQPEHSHVNEHDLSSSLKLHI